MTTKDKALALVKRLRIIPDQNGLMYEDYEDVMQAADLIEQHEAFKQEVSNTIQAMLAKDGAIIRNYLDQFIIPKPKPDPLVAAMKKAGWGDAYINNSEPSLRAALDALGFEIREKNDG